MALPVPLEICGRHRRQTSDRIEVFRAVIELRDGGRKGGALSRRELFKPDAVQYPRRRRFAQRESVRAEIAANRPGVPPAIAEREFPTPSAWPFSTRTVASMALLPRTMRTQAAILRPALRAVASFKPSAWPQTCFVNGFGHSCSHGFPA